MKKTARNIYLGFILFLMYAPIATLVVLSFNSSKSRSKWGGFTLKWYSSLFQDDAIMSALYNTLAITVFKKDISSLCFVSLSAISLRCFRSTSAICRLWSACMFCILSCRASMVSSWSAISLCRAVFSLSNVLTLLLPKREPTLSAMLAAAVVAAPFSFSVCISFFACLSSSRAVSFCCCKSTTSALRSSESFCISR